MQNCIQSLPLRLVVEYDRAQLLSVKGPIRRQHLLAKVLDNLLEPCGTRLDDLSRYDIGVDDRNALIAEQRRDGRFAGRDASRQTYD